MLLTGIVEERLALPRTRVWLGSPISIFMDPIRRAYIFVKYKELIEAKTTASRTFQDPRTNTVRKLAERPRAIIRHLKASREYENMHNFKLIMP